MLSDRIGELAALGTSLLWSLTYVQFTIAVRSAVETLYHLTC